MSTKRFRGSVTLAAYVFAAASLLMTLSGCSGDNSSTGSDGGGVDATAEGNVGADSGGKDSTSPTDGSSCPTGQASCGGKCVTLSSDPTNCGTCGSTCGAGLVCSNGTCALSCGDGGGLTQCGNGCYNLQTDSNNCGTCGTACTSGQSCVSGTCQATCGGGSTLCGTQCVDTQENNLNCGACNAACAPGTVCSAGVCQVTCGTGLSQCTADGGSLCKDLTSDGNNCGSCGNVCATGTVCSGGVCAGSCQPPLVACSGGCVNPASNNQYCGAAGTCGTTCASGLQCVSGACSIVCPPGQIECGGACVDPTSNNTYCGASGSSCTGGVACGTGTVCTGGQCKANCNPGQIICGGTCVAPLTNLTYCGATGNCTGANAGTTCPPGDVCSGGICQVTCSLGSVACGGNCIDPSSNLNYCGASGNCSSGDQGADCTKPPFGGGYLCAAGICTLSCQSGDVNCNSSCINPLTNNTYCGAGANCSPAGTPCASGTVCAGGSCQLTCLTGQAECTESGTLQCINPKTDPNFCGAAGYSGTGNTTGQCDVTSPATDPNYKGVACATTFAVGSSCSGGACTCPTVNGVKEVVCNVSGTPTCIDSTTNNAFCGVNSACAQTTATNCANTSGSACVSGVCTCPNGSGGATDKEVVCNVNGVQTCIDPLTDNPYCGANSACGNFTPCSGIKGSNCTAGACTCPAVGADQYVDCDVAGQQTCIDPETSNTNCGAAGTCKVVSPSTDPNYEGATCSSTTLTQCGAQSGGGPTTYGCVSECTGNQKACLSGTPPYCANYKTDPANCGSCGNVCPPLTACGSNGAGGYQCNSTCLSPQSPCGLDGGAPYCANLNTDNNNCGTCGNVCNSLLVCAGGSCGSSCGANATLCSPDAGGSPYCTSLITDGNNCGACFNVCPAGEDCVNSTCTPLSCKAILTTSPGSPSGLYTIDPDGTGPIPAQTVYCDMTSNGGGWTNLDFVNNQVHLANNITVACTGGLTYTVNSITCTLPYFNGNTSEPLYQYACAGNDNSVNYVIDFMGPILGHQAFNTIGGWTVLTQAETTITSTNNLEYCYIGAYSAGETYLWSDSHCNAYNSQGNGDCVPGYFTLTH